MEQTKALSPLELKAARLHVLTLLENAAKDARLSMVFADELLGQSQNVGIEAAPAGVLTALNGSAPVAVPPSKAQALRNMADQQHKKSNLEINNLQVLMARLMATFGGPVLHEAADPTSG